MCVNAIGSDGTLIDHAKTQMWLESNGKFNIYALTFNVPANTDHVELVVWCGQNEGTYLFDDFTVN